jgi:hypothetical protein
MTSRVKNKIRALLLMMVFSLSTIAGFACSVGLDLGYNSGHHEDPVPACHSGAGSHPSVQKANVNNSIPGEMFSDRSKAKDCCTNEVTDFIKMEKSVTQGMADLQAPVFALAFASVFIAPVNNPEFSVTPNGFQFLRRGSPLHDTDIRIVIQSFQI